MKTHDLLALLVSFGSFACSASGGSVTAPDAGPTDATPSAPDAGGGADAGSGADAGPPGDAGPPTDPLAGVEAPTLIQGGYTFTEGAVWRSRGVFQFVDLGTDRLYEVDAEDRVTVTRPRLGGAVGLEEDAQGDLLVAGHWGRNLTVVREGALPEVIVDAFEGQPLNSPNDLARAGDGSVYFTDPPFGLADPGDRALDFHGVFRWHPDEGLSAEYRAPLDVAPNGAALSPAGAHLYVANSWGAAVLRFAVGADGHLGPPEAFATTARGPDGLATDAEGNLYVATDGAVEVYAPDGARWGAIELPDAPTNLAFGGPERRTLFVTAISGVYRVQVPIPGAPPP